MTLHWPQITILIIFAIDAGAHLATHGKQRTGKSNFIIEVLGSLGMIYILYKGGFFGQ